MVLRITASVLLFSPRDLCSPIRSPVKNVCVSDPSQGINTLVLVLLHWPVLKCPPMAGFQVSTEAIQAPLVGKAKTDRVLGKLGIE